MEIRKWFYCSSWRQNAGVWLRSINQRYQCETFIQKKTIWGSRCLKKLSFQWGWWQRQSALSGRMAEVLGICAPCQQCELMCSHPGCAGSLQEQYWFVISVFWAMWCQIPNLCFSPSDLWITWYLLKNSSSLFCFKVLQWILLFANENTNNWQMFLIISVN